MRTLVPDFNDMFFLLFLAVKSCCSAAVWASGQNVSVMSSYLQPPFMSVLHLWMENKNYMCTSIYHLFTAGKQEVGGQTMGAGWSV